jgi:hypothetical protein
VRVVRARQQGLELELLEVALERLDGAGQLGREVRVVAVREQLVDRDGVVETALEAVVALERRVQPGELRRDALAARRVVPERGIRGLLLQLLGATASAVDVKGTPGRPGAVPRSRAGGRCTRSS